jgi:hypothetical protein
MKLIDIPFWRLVAVVLGTIALSACNGSSNGGGSSATENFDLRSDQQVVNLTEGDSPGASLTISVDRINNFAGDVQLSLLGVQDSDSVNMVGTFASESLAPGSDSTALNLALNISAQPILPQERRLIVRASDGSNTADLPIIVNVAPTTAPDVYLLVGQSNMVGFSGDGTKEAYPGGPDEPSDRIQQLNVTENDQFNIFTTSTTFTSSTSNARAPSLVVAEDPLHVTFDPDRPDKIHAYIGLGLSFAKAALNDTSANIVLVPAAWSGSAFCDNDGGPNGQWNAQPTTDPNLGNTFLFDRAVTRANLALNTSGGILRGILWHQGESDSNERCSYSYLANLERLAQELRLSIVSDRRGGDWRRADANIPFVVGSMSRGFDNRGDLSDYTEDKLRIDAAHRQLPNQIPFAGLSNHDDLTPANGYACGNTSCIHFGPAALREMGRRYYAALRQAALQ